MYVEADFSPFMSQINTSAGALNLDNVRVNWFSRDNVTITPSAISNVRITVKQPDVQYTIEYPIPIEKITQRDLEERYRVTYEPGTLSNLKVVGPAEQIEAIKNKTAKVRARFEVTSTDQADRDLTKTLEVVLPPGVSVAGNTPPQITIRLVPR
jgi:hypothetical protein